MFLRSLLLLLLLVACPFGFSGAQDIIDEATAHPTGGNYMPVRFGQVNLDTGNLSISLPLMTFPTGNGTPGSTITLDYDSTIWSSVDQGTGVSLTYPVSGWKIGNQASGSGSNVTYTHPRTETCPYQSSEYQNGVQGTYQLTNTFYATAEDGSSHYFFFPSGIVIGNCYDKDGNTIALSYPLSGSAVDGVGYKLTVNNIGSGYLTKPDGNSGLTTNGNILVTLARDYLYHDSTGLVVQLSYSDSCNSALLDLTGSQGGWWGNEPYSSKEDFSCVISKAKSDGTATAPSVTLTVSYIPVCTAFNVTGNANQREYCGGIWVVSGLTTPTGSYHFSYDQGQSAGHYGQLTGLTLSTGGSLSYSYSSVNVQQNEWYPLTKFLQSVTDNGGTTSIDYSRGTVAAKYDLAQYGMVKYPITITHPPHRVSATAAAASDITTFSLSSSGSTATLTRDDYSGNDVVLETKRDYSSPPLPTYVQTTWTKSGESSRVDYTYQLVGGANLVSDKVESLNGNTYRSTHITYLQDTSTAAYVSQFNMLNYPTSIVIKDASGNRIAETDLGYDEYSAGFCSRGPNGRSGVSGLIQVDGGTGHDAAHDTSWIARGNVTTVSRWVTGTTFTTEHRCYDTLGNVTEVVDGNGNATQYGYTENNGDNACPTPTGWVNASRATSITNALGQQTKMTYYSCSRQPEYVDSANDIDAGRHGTTYTFDQVNRPLCTTYADGGSVCRSYLDPNNFSDTQNVDASQQHVVKSTLDSFGNLSVSTDQQTGAVTSHTYDLLGRISTTTLPAAGGASPQTGVFYDALSRPTIQIAGDGTSTTQYVYTGPSVDVYDPVGGHRFLKYDALNRLIRVDELGTKASPVSIETDYSYDGLGNLSGVVQGSSGPVPRVRSFAYDGLSRLYFTSNPETGPICYGQTRGAAPTRANCDPTTGYDNNGNLLWRTSASLKTLHSQYDVLNRVVAKQYSDGTPTSCFQYDSSVLAAPGANLTGQLTNTWSQVGSCMSPTSASSFSSNVILSRRSILQYDPTGRLLHEQQCTRSNCSTSSYTPSYTYNYLGGVTSQTDGSGRLTFNTAYDAAGRLLSLTGNNGTSTPLVSQPKYYPAGMLNSVLLGTGLTKTRTYDQQYRPVSESDTSTSQSGTPGTVSILITGSEQGKP